MASVAPRLFPVVAMAFVLTATSLFAAHPYKPQPRDPLVEPWRWRVFPELSGLGAQCMAEDSAGRMWFGTSDGLWCYDGISWGFRQFGTPVVRGISSLAPAPKNGLYVASRTIVGRLEANGNWSVLFPRAGGSAIEIRKIAAAPDGTLWAATGSGLLHVGEASTTLFTTADLAPALGERAIAGLSIEVLPASLFARPRAGATGRRCDLVELAVDGDRRLWLGNASGEIIRLELPVGSTAGLPLQWTLFNEADGVSCGRAPSIVARRDGSVWVVYSSATASASVFADGRWTTKALADLGLPSDGGQLVETRDGRLWLSGRYVLYAEREGAWRRYSRPEFPVPWARNLMLQAADGAIWLCGPSTEIQRLGYQTTRWLTLLDLNFQWESPTGTEWFIARDGRVVRRDGDAWLSLGPEDGLIDTPVALIGTRSGEVWVAGSHGGVAATARLREGRWDRQVHNELSWGIDPRGVFESSDGSLWFSATVDSSGPKQWRAGILQYRDGRWIHHHQPGRAPTGQDDSDPATLLPATQKPEPVGKFLVLGESSDGRIWAGRNLLVYRLAGRWHTFRSNDPGELYGTDTASGHGNRLAIIESMLSTRRGDLWVGTRQYGLLRWDGEHWLVQQGRDRLVANSIRSLADASDGTVWAATDRGISRYDGQSWISDVLPDALDVPHEGGELKAAASGALWVNRHPPEWIQRAWSARTATGGAGEFWTTCRRFIGQPPDTTVSAASTRVPPPGNLSVFWSGTAQWSEPGDGPLDYSFRLDDGEWSPYTREEGHSFFTLSSGPHHIEVRARDRDFHVDPTPAVLDFVVLPPVWRQRWFVLLMSLCGGAVVTLGVRVVLEHRRLQTINRALQEEITERRRAEEALRKLNRELDQRVKARTSELEIANHELESFSYTVSHDLRAPLRTIDGFSKALLEDYGPKLDEEGKSYLQSVRRGAQRMGRLIDDLLRLSRVTRGEIHAAPVDLSRIAHAIKQDLVAANPGRSVVFSIAPDMVAVGDARFLTVALENLLGNAWKFTSKRPEAKIQFGVRNQDGERVFFISDNGAGFDMTQATRLFQPFRRLHTEEEFGGNGIGLATVQRIIQRHGGRLWADGELGVGATFFFVLPEQPS